MSLTVHSNDASASCQLQHALFGRQQGQKEPHNMAPQITPLEELRKGRYRHLLEAPGVTCASTGHQSVLCAHTAQERDNVELQSVFQG